MESHFFQVKCFWRVILEHQDLANDLHWGKCKALASNRREGDNWIGKTGGMHEGMQRGTLGHIVGAHFLSWSELIAERENPQCRLSTWLHFPAVIVQSAIPILLILLVAHAGTFEY